MEPDSRDSTSTKGAPTEQTVKHVKIFDRSSDSSNGQQQLQPLDLTRSGSVLAVAGGADAACCSGWATSVALGWQVTFHTDTSTDMQDISEASPERLRARKAAAGRTWACRAQLMQTGAEGLAVWRPQARSGLPGIHTVPGHVHLRVASM